MTARSELLVTVSVAAAAPERIAELRELIVAAREKAVATREELYECFLQLYLFAGFPASLEAMRVLKGSWPGDAAQSNDNATSETGEDLFGRIYGSNAGAVRTAMTTLSPDLAERAIVEGYGRTLSRGELDIQTRELAIVAILTDRGWHRQLYSHIRGAKNVGADREEIESAVRIGSNGDSARLELGLELIERSFA